MHKRPTIRPWRVVESGPDGTVDHGGERDRRKAEERAAELANQLDNNSPVEIQARHVGRRSR